MLRQLFRCTTFIMLAIVISACTTRTDSPMFVFPSSEALYQLPQVSQVQLLDVRENKTLAKINHRTTPPSEELQNNLNTWLNTSIDTSKNGHIEIDFELLSFASYTLQGTMQFETEAIMEWQVYMSWENGATWRKSFQVSMNAEGAMNLEKKQIEGHLNRLANRLLDVTMQDPEFQQALNRSAL